jgi:hypothetical protein
MGVTEEGVHIVSEQQMTDAGRQTYSELGRMTEREILQVNNLRLRVIERELHSIKTLLIGIITACIGFVAAVVILNWLG